jgi:hypothetical protein
MKTQIMIMSEVNPSVQLYPNEWNSMCVLLKASSVNRINFTRFLFYTK